MLKHVRQDGADTRIRFKDLYPGCGFGRPRLFADLIRRLADVQSKSGRYSGVA